MSAHPVIPNKIARRLFLDRSGLCDPPTGGCKGQDLLDVIHGLGFVQVDSINIVERAHHMILHARRHNYRPKHLTPLLEKERTLFEHWTHDASIIPTSFYPHWKLRFNRDGERLRRRWKDWRRGEFEEQFETILSQIRNEGPVGSGDVGKDEPRSSGGWWDWHPSKTALEYLWRSGQLSVTRRESFRKIYDLTNRVLPDHAGCASPDVTETIDWASDAALDRIGFGTSGEIAAFWDKITPAETKQWAQDNLERGDLIEVDIEAVDGSLRRSFMRPEILDILECKSPPSSIRILSPFDPALRDRKRAERLFGFHYRIEVFVPAAKRQYGYYVFPVLEGDTMIGRIDMKCHRKQDCLIVTAFWPEKSVKLGKLRMQKLQSALHRTSRFAGVNNVMFQDGWQRDHRQ